jgi:hypothetical protein
VQRNTLNRCARFRFEANTSLVAECTVVHEQTKEVFNNESISAVDLEIDLISTCKTQAYKDHLHQH